MLERLSWSRRFLGGICIAQRPAIQRFCTIQLIVSENCCARHGPDPGTHKAGLHLGRAEFCFRASQQNLTPHPYERKSVSSPLLGRIEKRKSRCRPSQPSRAMSIVLFGNREELWHTCDCYLWPVFANQRAGVSYNKRTIELAVLPFSPFSACEESIRLRVVNTLNSSTPAASTNHFIFKYLQR